MNALTRTTALMLVAAAGRDMAAQTTQATLDELRTPASPAFVLLGVAPSAVERPTTPKALAATLLAASGDLQFFPKNYAIEVAPYWLSSHPSLTYERFHDPGVWQSLKQTLSLSLAASRSSPILSDSGTAVGLGARMFVSSGFTDRKQLDALTAQLDTVQQQQNLATLRNAPTAVGDSLAIKNDRLTRQLQALVQDRLGYIVEAAAALIAAYPLDAFAKGRVARVGAWVTQTYRLHHPQADVLVVSRFIRDVGAARNLYDVGGRLAYSNRGLTIAGEYVGRFGRSRADKTHRAAGTLEYRWAEGKYITATFGRNFDESTGKTLIALIGVDLGFGKVPMLGLK